MITREANIEDWDKLSRFYSRIYRPNHPLLSKAFWQWQYGDKNHGRSFVYINSENEIAGHVGANFKGGLAWIINVYLDKDSRGKGVLRKLYDLARAYYPLAATAANEAGLGLYQNMRWYRYYDLVRYVKLNPYITDPKFENICKPVEVSIQEFIVDDTHYFKQPNIEGMLFKDGSRAVCQKAVGGLRAADIEDLHFLESQAWDLGYLWIDYITSWNDLKTKLLIKNNWKRDYETVVPWRLNPIEKGYFCDITFLSEKPLDNEYVVHRSFSDHGRVGSI